ncbi:hypothetical protein OUZ56_008750 [Daphnia magna]|uniref:Uncharacterized protein n=1 Tax=Daphnia magna TaxID=35525 RepID=A0ABR0AE26_9CRUS|nr:hypothetical protein OUZ56_008750 [Daphnia magna]
MSRIQTLKNYDVAFNYRETSYSQASYTIYMTSKDESYFFVCIRFRSRSTRLGYTLRALVGCLFSSGCPDICKQQKPPPAQTPVCMSVSLAGEQNRRDITIVNKWNEPSKTGVV